MDIDTTPPSPHHDARPAMQLDLSSTDDVMMEVDPDVSSMSAPLESTDAANTRTTAFAPQTTSSPTVLSFAQPSPTRVAIDGGSQPTGPLSVPPVVLITSSDSPAWPKFKLDQLFVEWLARSESRKWLDKLLEDARSGKPPEHLITEYASRISRFERAIAASPSRATPMPSQSHSTVSPQQAPGSPVSRLFSSHAPFGYADLSPRSPPSAPIGISSPLKPTISGLTAIEFDLGKSGSASPISKPSPSRDLSVSPSAKLTDKIEASSKDRVAASDDGKAVPAKIGSAESRGEAAQQSSLQSSGRLVQVTDSKILDRVADGIAGMVAAADPSGERTPREKRAEDGKVWEGADESKQQGLPSNAQLARESTAVDNRDSSSTQIVEKEKSLAESRLGDATAVSSSHAKPGTEESENRRDDVHVSSQKMGEVSTVGVTHISTATAKDTDMTAVHVTEGGKTATLVQLERDRRKVYSAVPPSGAKASKSADMIMLESSVPKKRKTLPRFYYPCGRDAENREQKEKETIKDFFKAQLSQKNLPGVNRTDIAELVVEVIGLPSYFAGIVFTAIQELFPSANGGSEMRPGLGTNRDAAKTESSQASGETSMKDVGQGDEDMGVRSQQQGRGNIREDSGATNSDTTMGDVNDSISEDGRANGYTSVTRERGVANGSSAVQQTSRPSGEMSPTSKSDIVTEDQFTAYYKMFCEGASREARLFSALKDPKAKRKYLIPSDFKPLLRALLMCHQGLAFLHATPEFQQRYSETVIERIYFGCTRQHNGRLTLNDIKRSKLLETLMIVDEEEDINRERKYFSYEHFYVLYCRFWELDANHDLQIDREDLMRYGSHSLTYRIVDRIFGGYARPLDCPENAGFMSYKDFIWFCLSEEDKTSDTAIDYWFRCVDMDGDGLITMYDMEFFYKEQLHRMECFGHEPVQIRDILCQLLDMINPNMRPPVIRRRDLKRCRLAGNFFNVLFNLNKFFAIEARDPLQIRQEHATPELTDWDRFAALEYLRLSAEEEGEEDESWEDVGDSSNPLMAGEAPF